MHQENTIGRQVNIQIRSSGKYESYTCLTLQIDEKQIDLLSPMNGTEAVPIRPGSDVTLSFIDTLEESPKTYHTIALDQTWNKELEAYVLTVTQPENKQITLRQFVRHEVSFQVTVQLLAQDRQFDALSVDISGSGIQIVIALIDLPICLQKDVESINNGEELQLQFKIHELNQWLDTDYEFTITGRVVRISEESSKSEPTRLFGIKFVSGYDEEDQQAITQYILRDQIRRHRDMIHKSI